MEFEKNYRKKKTTVQARRGGQNVSAGELPLSLGGERG